ncbi:hypothetical protein V3481_018566 [Fusarium oxysporum f. sp. vasinfectum]|uniref:Uncharacterized protein n=1 Tax=Fusarium oxysporum f. sp. vasinfectum 25433 TaxID=1089449 RepID=X0KIN5_FUSOX|nr:hypothetical protein FOTG_18063 [Fusarium oxysporum f. sp. vasinfectum 25433]
MKYLIPLSLLIASAFAQDGCGFPDGPDCVSLGEGANGLEQFADDGCCLLPIRCGNGDGGERCERVAAGGNNNNNNNANDNANAGNGNGNVNDNGNNNNNANGNDENCGFPNGPDCESLGEGANGLEQFADDGCCLLPFRCGNGDGGERCERVPAAANNRVRFIRAARSLHSGVKK